MFFAARNQGFNMPSPLRSSNFSSGLNKSFTSESEVQSPSSSTPKRKVTRSASEPKLRTTAAYSERVALGGDSNLEKLKKVDSSGYISPKAPLPTQIHLAASSMYDQAADTWQPLLSHDSPSKRLLGAGPLEVLVDVRLSKLAVKELFSTSAGWMGHKPGGEKKAFLVAVDVRKLSGGKTINIVDAVDRKLVAKPCTVAKVKLESSKIHAGQWHQVTMKLRPEDLQKGNSIHDLHPSIVLFIVIESKSDKKMWTRFGEIVRVTVLIPPVVKRPTRPAPFVEPPCPPAFPGPPTEEFIKTILKEDAAWAEWRLAEERLAAEERSSQEKEAAADADRAWAAWRLEEEDRLKQQIEKDEASLDEQRVAFKQSFLSTVTAAAKEFEDCPSKKDDLWHGICKISNGSIDDIENAKRLLETERKQGHEERLQAQGLRMKQIEEEQEKARKDETQKRMQAQQLVLEKQRMDRADEVNGQWEISTLSSHPWQVYLSQARSWISSVEQSTRAWDAYQEQTRAWDYEKGLGVFMEFGISLGFGERAVPSVAEPADWAKHPILRHAEDSVLSGWAEVNSKAMEARSQVVGNIEARSNSVEKLRTSVSESSLMGT